ncbi:hypothetical protein TSUD_86810 [Trifolium subterraneum]|uniref:Uncharacterized protein n=1 Tax=Trifolium subterraneum TaxID=3900 RepID=A0A2Z6PAS5_TRISU|nr:hypothetical protein TSUD_86810 [Trifolium subterraneum]
MTQQLPQQNVDVPDLLNHEIFMKCENKIPMNEHYDQGIIQDHEAAMNINLGVTSNSLNDDSTLPSHPPIVNAHFTDPFSITQFQGVGEAEDFTEKCIVSINNHIFKVNVGPFNICQIFGDEAVLVDSSGQTILTDECGITLESLQHGASYYVYGLLIMERRNYSSLVLL